MGSLGFQFSRKTQCKKIIKKTKELREIYEKELKGKKINRSRILITGCPTGGVRQKVIKRIEELAADIVAFENCGEPKEKKDLVDEMIYEYKIDGVIGVILQVCHTFNVESYNVKKFVTKEKNKPYICIETDYSKSDTGQINTRLNAFIEML